MRIHNQINSNTNVYIIKILSYIKVKIYIYIKIYIQKTKEFFKNTVYY